METSPCESSKELRKLVRFHRGLGVEDFESLCEG